ncbi:hypothetical protein HRbin27_01697 [bacterium HR27]|nr:hypothetical protein HRbin27_01697 [bacterium HR27]
MDRTDLQAHSVIVRAEIAATGSFFENAAEIGCLGPLEAPAEFLEADSLLARIALEEPPGFRETELVVVKAACDPVSDTVGPGGEASEYREILRGELEEHAPQREVVGRDPERMREVPSRFDPALSIAAVHFALHRSPPFTSRKSVPGCRVGIAKVSHTSEW